MILNVKTGQWGTEYHKEKDVVRVKEKAEQLNESIEQLTIRFEDKNMIIEWDKTRVRVPVQTRTSSLAAIQQAIGNGQ